MTEIDFKRNGWWEALKAAQEKLEWWKSLGKALEQHDKLYPKRGCYIIVDPPGIEPYVIYRSPIGRTRAQCISHFHSPTKTKVMKLLTIEITHGENAENKVNCVEKTVKTVKLLGVTILKKTVHYPKHQPSEWVNP